MTARLGVIGIAGGSTSTEDVEADRSLPVPANREARREVVEFVECARGRAGVVGVSRGIERFGNVACIEKEGQFARCKEEE